MNKFFDHKWAGIPGLGSISWDRFVSGESWNEQSGLILRIRLLRPSWRQWNIEFHEVHKQRALWPKHKTCVEQYPALSMVD